jgi:N-acetylglucosaminyl-diphospho-decaprenol L-rhamnosyltransferase
MVKGRLPVAAVVVNYNARDHLGACLESIAAQGVGAVIVVDNASIDGSRVVVEACGATWVQSGGNIGYGRAANLGVSRPEASGAKFVLVSNPDLVLADGAVARMLDALEGSPELALVGPRINEPDGSLYPSARSFPNMVDAAGHGALGLIAPRNQFTRRYRMLDWDHASSASVDWVSGACFLVRREAWEQVHGFDPAYFMYMEDVDLCWRLGGSGWKIGYEPGALVTHTQGVSADQHPYRMLAAHHRSMWRFALRSTSGADRAALPFVGCGLALRFAASCLKRRLAGTIRAPLRGPLP